MEEKEKAIINKNIILVSRNRPIALVVGVAGFIGSSVSEALLRIGVQVIGMDNFSTGTKTNLKELIKSKNFHLINGSINDGARVDLPRLDYAFFAARNDSDELLYTKGLQKFLDFTKAFKHHADKPRIALTSSIELYGNKLGLRESALKKAEINFARYVKYYKLNGRIIRLAAVYGPRMNFDFDDPALSLIRASIMGELNNTQDSISFSTRALYISDAVNLILKSVLLGATSHKIFDGLLPQPIQVSELKQILLDPVWFEMRNFKPSELPPWPTPNLKSSTTNLSWSPSVGLIEGLKKTVTYFRDNNIEIPKTNSAFKEETSNYQITESKAPEINEALGDDAAEEKPSRQASGAFGVKSKILYIAVIMTIVYGLIYPVAKFTAESLSIRSKLVLVQKDVERGDFASARKDIAGVRRSLNQLTNALGNLKILKRLGILTNQVEGIENILSISGEGADGVEHAIIGIEQLYQATKIISGEFNSDPMPLYNNSQVELTTAVQKLSKVKTILYDQEFIRVLPAPIKDRALDLSKKLSIYITLVEKGRVASFILPKITAVEGKKSYLVLLQNNLELRGTGGFIGSYARLDFEKGRIAGIKVDDIYNLDGGLQDIVAPPDEIKEDLGQNRLFLRDSNFEPDFPTSARQAEFFYKKEAGDIVNGVLAIDLSASSKLLDSVSGVDLPDYGEHVDGSNLFERSIVHAEANFFPGSQAKKNYLTSLQNQLFNKIFYLSKQNWPEIIRAVGESLEQKHILVYFSDPELFSYLVSENWAGILPRGVAQQEGEFLDFIAPVESNYGANKANYYLERMYDLTTVISKEGAIAHKLAINYKNNSPSEVFPAGTYKNRFKLYLPSGARLDKVLFGESDITKDVKSFSDYGRTAYSVLTKILPKEQKSLIIEYSEVGQFKFSDNKISYRLDFLKQPGLDKDPFLWKIAYPLNFKPEVIGDDYKLDTQEIKISTDLSKDRSFLIKFRQD